MQSVNQIPANNYDERSIVKDILSGNEAAFRALIRNTEGLVAQIVYKMIPVAEDRKDIAQDIYLKVFKNLEGFSFNSRLSTWIARIAYNTCLNYLEKNRIMAEDPQRIDADVGADFFSGKAEEQLFTKDRIKILQAAMEKLSPIYKTLITLYHNEGLNYQQISEITGLPNGTVKSYLFRARQTLRKLILQTYQKDAL